MKKLFYTFVCVIFVSLVSCTDNAKVRFWGGNETITLPPGDRLVNITWKGGERETTSLWLLTKKNTTKPTTYSFKEKSSFGMLEGEIIIKEQ